MTRVVLSCLLTLLALTVSCSKTPAGPAFGMGAVDVRAVEATSSNVPFSISAIGNVEALSSVEIKPRVAAQITRVAFHEGQDIRVGDVLFELDQAPFLDAIHENEANLARDEALAKQYRANVLKDEAQLRSALSQAERALQLQKEGINSREATEGLVATADGLKASRAADEASVISAEASVRADRARLEDARLMLSYTTIKSPISGRAGAVQVKAGNLVKENDTTLVTILQMKPVYVTFSVPEQQLALVRKHNSEKPLEVSASVAGGELVRGRLAFVDNAVDTTSGTIKLKAIFDNNNQQLWPGQFANVVADLAIEPNRVVVPTQTIQTGPNGQFVWVIASDSTVSMRPVDVLRAWGEKSVLGSGISVGEKIITEGQMRLAPGAKVKILPDRTAEKATQGKTPSGA